MSVKFLVGLIMAVGLPSIVACSFQSENKSSNGNDDFKDKDSVSLIGMLPHADLDSVFGGVIKWETTDSVGVFFDYGSFYGAAVVKQNLDAEKPERIFQLYQYDGKDSFDLIKETSKIFGTTDWGIGGNDAFGNLYMSPNGLVFVFVSGDPINRLQQEYYFDYCEHGLWLRAYTKRGFSILNVDNDGLVNKELVEEYDFSKNISSIYDFVENQKMNLKSATIDSHVFLIDNINAMKGIGF